MTHNDTGVKCMVLHFESTDTKDMPRETPNPYTGLLCVSFMEDMVGYRSIMLRTEFDTFSVQRLNKTSKTSV